MREAPGMWRNIKHSRELMLIKSVISAFPFSDGEVEDGNVGSLKGTQAHRGLLRFLIFLHHMKEMIVSF